MELIAQVGGTPPNVWVMMARMERARRRQLAGRAALALTATLALAAVGWWAGHAAFGYVAVLADLIGKAVTGG